MPIIILFILFRRHVCSSHKTIPQPVKTVQTFCKPTYKKYVQRCNDNQLCTGVK